jgi:hypothetical protein
MPAFVLVRSGQAQHRPAWTPARTPTGGVERSLVDGGTEGSNLLPSSGESSANLDIGDLAGAVVVAVIASSSSPPR